MKNFLKNYLFLISIAGVIVILDQWTKNLVRTNIAFSQTWMPLEWLSTYARIVHWRNTGAAFGIFQNLGGFFTILAFVVIGIILIFFPQIPRSDWPMRVAMSMQLGGAVGNLIDRLARGHVTDFISVGNFAVFNVADASISLGVAVLILGMWIQDRNNRHNHTETKLPSSETETIEDPL
ncbi:MAG: signal peptidase II [Chloroflexi bacterium]|nr:signal peptidase II [Chloroflexota bacterium]